MRQLIRFVASMAAIVMAATSVTLGFGTHVAAADDTASATGANVVPLSSILRRCDWTSAPYVPSDNKGSGYAVISRNGDTVTADVHMLAVVPDIWYGVRLVQVPRPGISCAAGDPGVGVGRLYTDGAGNGSVIVSAPVMDGATGAWVSVEGPLGTSIMLSGDFRTSDYVAKI
jgi:hypothetical protein